MTAVTRYADANTRAAASTSTNNVTSSAMPGRQLGREAHTDNAEGRRDSATALSVKKSGDVLLSHAVPHAVPSALKGLTSGFGMGPGVSPSLWSPKHYGDVIPGPTRSSIEIGQADRIPRTAQWTQSTHQSPSENRNAKQVSLGREQE